MRSSGGGVRGAAAGREVRGKEQQEGDVWGAAACTYSIPHTALARSVGGRLRAGLPSGRRSLRGGGGGRGAPPSVKRARSASPAAGVPESCHQR